MTPRLIHIVASNVWTGRDRYALDICRHFSSSGWRVAVLSREARAVDRHFESHGIELLHAPLEGWSDPRAIILLRKEIRMNGRSGIVIHAHRYRDALRAIIARWLSGKAGKKARIILTRHTSMRARRNPVYEYVYRHLDSHLFMSEFSMNRFRAGRSREYKNLMLQGGSLYPEDVAAADVTEVPEPMRGPIFATYQGRLREGKGLEVLIDALSLLSDVKLRVRICGTGNPDYVDRLRDRAQQRGVMDRIDWLRHYDETSVIITESHFGVFPAVLPESFGLNLVQFLANGRPVITTIGSAPGDYLTSGVDSLLVRPTDATELAAAMRRMATDAVGRRQMGREALATFRRNFDWATFISRLQSRYVPR